jgi:hypothetical protein
MRFPHSIKLQTSLMLSFRLSVLLKYRSDTGNNRLIQSENRIKNIKGRSIRLENRIKNIKGAEHFK